MTALRETQRLFPDEPFDPLADAQRILSAAVAEHDPSHMIVMFSGGNDSHTAAKVASSHSLFTGVALMNTGTGIRATIRHAYEMAKRQGWPFQMYRPMKGNRYHELVLAHGFPGPFHHRKMYNRLKERSIRRLINDHKVGDRRILLVTGVRRQESRRRMGHLSEIDREGRRVWVAPIINWSAADKEAYMRLHGLPGNPVTAKLCMSGECLCGAFASPGELEEIRLYYPKAAAEIDRLAEKCRVVGVHARWGERPPAKPDPDQLLLEDWELDPEVFNQEEVLEWMTPLRTAELIRLRYGDNLEWLVGAHDAGPTGGLCWSCDARRGAASVVSPI